MMPPFRAAFFYMDVEELWAFLGGGSGVSWTHI
jgi:hypothetical protein